MTTSEAQLKGVSYAQLVVFIICAFPALYCTIKHGKHGLLGWPFVFTFCCIRIIGAIITIHDIDTNTPMSIAAMVVTSLGINPLLAAPEGILHEARNARKVTFRKAIEYTLVFLYHGLGGVAAIFIVSKAHSLGNPNRSHVDQRSIDIAMFLFFIAWVTLVLWVTGTFVQKPKPGTSTTSKEFTGGNTLLRFVAATLPFSCMRVMYGLIYYVGNSPSFQGSFAARLVLGTIPEMIVIVVLIVGGIITRDMYAFKGKADLELQKTVLEPYTPVAAPQTNKAYAGAQYNRQDRPGVSRW